MAFKSDQSWMYMLPIKKNKKKINLPPISQLPGIGNAADESFPPDFGAKNYVPGHILAKSTDSDYNILCKKGGRTNLLTHRAFEPTSKDPVPYDRCDWFYQLDRDLEEKQVKAEKHAPTLPPYMVHKDFVPSKPPTEQPAPKEVKKKTKKVALIPPYDVCSYTDWYRSFPRRKYFKSTARHRYSRDPYSDLCPPPQWKDYPDKTEMVKLIANTYQKEWTEQRKEWNEEMGKVNKHNVEIYKKIYDNEFKKRLKPFDPVSWLKKSVFSNVCNAHQQSKKETLYQTNYCRPGYKPALAVPRPKTPVIPFPRYQEDNSKIVFTKLIAHQYAKENEKFAQKYKKDIQHYLDNRPKEKKPRKKNTTRLIRYC